MLVHDAHRFARAVSDLWRLEDICDRSAEQQLEPDQIADTKNQVREALSKVSDLCVDAGLDGRLGPEIRRFEAEIDTDTFRQLASRIDHLRERILDELTERLYFPVPLIDSHFYGQVQPFGAEVATTFASSCGEFQQAAQCLSLQRSTACVFHLMRGLEAAIQQLAGVIGMTVSPGTTWRQITARMDALIQPMRSQTAAEKEKKNDWEDARVNLHHLGSVLRNNTMHPSASHTQDEARHIFISVGVVMSALCRL